MGTRRWSSKVKIPGRFSLIRMLREDRESRTFLANDHLLDLENVVVKIFAKENVRIDRDQLLEQFSWLIGVSHDQFARVLDAGLTKQQHPYYVREYLPPSQPSVVPLMTVRSLVSAVDFLFKRHRLHGGIKPSNVFVTNDSFKLADPRFWAPKLFDTQESIHFTPPEVLKGGNMTHEGDLYSIGAFVYFMLTGRHLFEDLDLSRLKSKYVSATPQPRLYLSPLPTAISEPILELLTSSPQERPIAFERLKRAVSSPDLIPDSAAFIGREDTLRQTLNLVSKSTGALRAALIDGAIGVGKTRFVKELRLYCSFQGVTLVSFQCTKNSSILTTFRENLGKLLRAVESTRTESSTELAAFECPASYSNSSFEGKCAVEKTISDVIGRLSALARRTRIVLAIEDVHLADDGTVQFLQQVAFRASETPLALVLTRTLCLVEPIWQDTLAECLKTEFLRICLPRLSEAESQSLIQFMVPDRERQARVLKFSAGNPYFIESYAKTRGSWAIEPPALSEVANSMLSVVPKGTRPILQMLSVFRGPISVKIVAEICAQPLSELEVKLDQLSRLGLIERNGEMVEICLAIVQKKLFESIPNKRRVHLNRIAFLRLRELEPDAEVLSRYAYDARMFDEAARLYRGLASNAFSSHRYGTALGYYERLQKCCQSAGQIFTPAEMINMARCYDKAGRRRASALYKRLLSVEEVRVHPELLSTVYTRLAVTDSVPTKERDRLLELAIQCVPDEPRYVARYATLCSAFSRIGNLHRANELIEQAERYALTSVNDTAIVSACRAALLSNSGDFRGAVEHYLLSLTDGVHRQEVLNNVAYCFEQLGDMRRALEFQLRALELAIANGNVFVEIQSLGNIASIRTKLGDTSEAQHLLNSARQGIGVVNGGDLVDKDSLLLSIYADTAVLAIYQGDYRLSYDSTKSLRSGRRSVLHIDLALCEITRCKFFLAIGLTRKVWELLRLFEDLTIFSIDFLKVERALIEAQLFEIPAKDRFERLRRGLELSTELGTLYQQCELLISAATVHLELDERQKAEEGVRKALELAEENGYKLLITRGFLLLGIASEKLGDRLQALSDAVQLASEMGLQELLAEATYHMGILNLQCSNTITAREYLIRSTSITARLAEGVPAMARPKYLAKKWRRDALSVLVRCNESIPLHQYALFNTDSDKYFAASYQFTMAAAAAHSIEALLASLEKTLTTSFSRSVVITLKDETKSYSIPIRAKLSPELTQRIELIRTHSKSRVYFESAEGKGKHVNAWIPLTSETCEGGIYVTYRSHESPPTERDMELLTMVGTIASSNLKRLETHYAHEAEPRELSEFHGMIGASKVMKEVYSQIQIAARNAATVLIEGESGTGKELVAKAIHAAGPRGKAPFIAVDCGAIPETLIETELFGAKKGAYTGAVADRLGLFESAHGGTIFLDEISNTTPALQAKLLRVIQEREVRRIGDTKGRLVDVRLIVASNQSLERLAEEGKFRRDLLYRLKVLHVRLPALRDRLEDIPLLAHAFLQKLNTSNKIRKCFAPGVIHHLSRQRFAGNVRELQNVIERAFFSAGGIVITEVPLDSSTLEHSAPAGEIQNWFKDLSEGRKDFWSAIYKGYKRRDIPREKVVALVDFGLRSTRGNYKSMASVFRLQEKEYRKFMDFLRRNECLLDFRPYRKAAVATSREN